MEIILTNVEEAGMPAEMADNCKELISRRIQKEFGGLPTAGAEVTILYSEKDPLGKTKEADDNAYFIYFTVDSVEATHGGDPHAAKVKLTLVM
ncbi:MAG TPA: hypothetical protein VFV79_07920 [Saprospiraceae bacterium]|nr:hypothetical protein [Saprospiraceae bacterium]